jgi:CRP-like cAMP-binding protein
MADLRTDALSRTQLFSELSRRELARIARGMAERTVPAGATAATEGEVGVGFFIIAAGDARVTVGGQDVGRLGSGDHFGEIALIVDAPRTATVTAETDLHCYVMTSWEFRRLVETNAAVAWKVLRAMAQRLLKLERVRLESSAP